MSMSLDEKIGPCTVEALLKTGKVVINGSELDAEDQKILKFGLLAYRLYMYEHNWPKEDTERTVNMINGIESRARLAIQLQLAQSPGEAADTRWLPTESTPT